MKPLPRGGQAWSRRARQAATRILSAVTRTVAWCGSGPRTVEHGDPAAAGPGAGEEVTTSPLRAGRSRPHTPAFAKVRLSTELSDLTISGARAA